MAASKTDQVLERIAREHLFLETLQARGSDRLDFHDLGVASVKAALLAAFEAGQASKRTAVKLAADQSGH